MALVAGLAGCDSGPAPRRDASAPLQTERLTYEMTPRPGGWSTDIAFRFRNDAADTIYWPHCGRQLSISLDRLAPDSIADFWEPALFLCLSGTPVVIPPGGIYVDTLRVEGAEPGTGGSSAFSRRDLNGTYRMVWRGLLFHYDGRAARSGDPVPLRYRISNRFRLVQAR